MNIWREISNILETAQSVVYLKVVLHKGSSPGKQGFDMIVTADGILKGSIGGGRTEFQLVELARQMLKEGKSDGIIKKEVHRENDENSSGMICAGEQWVVLMPVFKKHKSIIEEISREKSGKLIMTPSGIIWNAENPENNYNFTYQSDTNWTYEENLNQKSLLYLVGGGHVGLATAKIFQDLDFDVTLFDNRKGLNTFEQDTFSDVKKIIDYQNITDFIIAGDQTYVVILTHNFSSDAKVIALLKDVNVRYIGVLGSASKIKSMFKSLEKNDVDKLYLQKIDAPIGMFIHSKTPAEIAVSIAARLIMIRNSL